MSRLDVEVENEVEKAEEVKKQHPTNGVRLHYIPNSPSGGGGGGWNGGGRRREADGRQFMEGLIRRDNLGAASP